MQELLESLHPLERKVLPYLQKTNSLKDLIKESKLEEVEVLRALQWLENKKLVTLQRSTKEIISIDNNGSNYIKKGLPEKRFLESIKNSPLTLKEIQDKTSLDQNELNISIGSLKKKNAITLKDKVSITEEGKKLLSKEFPEESFLKKLPRETKSLIKEEITIYNELSSRKELIKTDLIKEVNFSLTSLGKEISKLRLNENLIESLNTKILLSKEWKNKNFRRYDIKTQASKIYPGKRHFSNQASKYIKRIWLDLGFKEMEGPLIQSSFWNFDALFTAQDHPVRELQDTFFLDYPNKADLPDKKLVSKVKDMHESGKLVKSKGWQYAWNPEEAKKLVLRTHTTCLSAKTLSELKEFPAKFFSVGKVFRNETLDWSHLFEFTQTEGIVIDENANLQNLIGYLKEFFSKMGFEKIRVRPGYFPYVEPGIEVDVYHPIRKKWVELGGAGILRPEVVVPLLGKDIPVLAWGLGVDRIIVDYYDIKDLRDLYKNDVKKLREAQVWLK
ncbi:phenylalanine--tRNA ligase subunit alpha [Candidatus Woesearchaeota archaeon]|nr:phenylalanine--tRNA ligase subunit alpha [Candidatus Woesearchaeota archaeon]